MTETLNNSATELAILKNENEKLESQVSGMFNLMTMLSELSLSLDLDEVYRNILDILVVSVGSQRHSIALIDNAGVLKVVASKFGDDEVDFEHAILGKGVVSYVLETKEVFVVDDPSNNLDDVAACIPLMVNGGIVGVVIINELLSHKKGFTEEDRELFDLISSHAGYSLSAALVYEKSRKDVENKDKELTRFNDISSLVSSAADIDEVLDIILEAVSDLLICDIIAVMLYDDEVDKLLLRRSIGLDPELLGSYTLKAGEGISGKVFKEKKPIVIKDIANEVRYSDLLGCEEIKLYSRSIISVPIMIKGESIGIITVSKARGGKILDVPEKKLLTTVAAQAAIGIDHACLHERQEKELINISSLFIATNLLHSTLDLDEIYRIAKELLVEFIGAKTFSIMLKDASEKELNIVLSRGYDQDIVDSVKIPIGEGIIGKSVEDGKSFILSPDQSIPTVRLGNKDFELFACIPLRLEDKMAGAIVINELLAQKNDFIKFDRDLFDLMAQHTAIAILRAQLFAKSEQKTSSAYDLSRLLTIEYNLKKSLTITLRLIHKNIASIKSAVLIYEHPDKTEYTALAYDGYEAEEINRLDLNKKTDITQVSLSYNEHEIGMLRVERVSREPFTKDELDALKIAGSLISQFIYHDKSFKISKNLAIMLNKEQAQSKAIIKGVAEGLLVTDMKNKIMLANPTVETLFNFKEKEAIGVSLEKFIHNEDVKKMLYNALEKGYSEKDVDIKVDDNTMTLEVKTSLVMDEKKKSVGVVTIMRDITREIEAERVKDDFLKKLKKISITDPLTNIYNRRYFDERLKIEYDRSTRYKRNFSCIMIDADNFKNVNDTYGHDVGDEVLKYIATTIKKGLRGGVDVVARYGGEEFVIILPETDGNNAYVVAERLRKAIEKAPFLTNGHSLKLAISLGISSYPYDEIKSADDIVKFADTALYRAKEGGRNRVEAYK